MLRAAIDLGTNTFHLIIAEVEQHRIIKIHNRISRVVRLAKDGFAPISEESIQRALLCLHDFAAIITQYDVEEVEIVGTEALRSATNQADILERIRHSTGYEVRIISGEEEAMYNYISCLKAIPKTFENFLIMDIGGGSVEFIIGNQDEILYLQSVRIGVQHLFAQFCPSDPITPEEIKSIFTYLNLQLHDLRLAIDHSQPTYLVGVSGSFEIVAELTYSGFFDDRYATILIDAFVQCYDQMIYTTIDERINTGKVTPDKAELLITGLVLMRQVVNMFTPTQILVSNYALREGLLLANKML